MYWRSYQIRLPIIETIDIREKNTVFIGKEVDSMNWKLVASILSVVSLAVSAAGNYADGKKRNEEIKDAVRKEFDRREKEES